MLFKKFGSDVYQKANSAMAAEYKTYQTDNGKETLDITKNYTVLKQGKGFFKFCEEKISFGVFAYLSDLLIKLAL